MSSDLLSPTRSCYDLLVSDLLPRLLEGWTVRGAPKRVPIETEVPKEPKYRTEIPEVVFSDIRILPSARGEDLCRQPGQETPFQRLIIARARTSWNRNEEWALIGMLPDLTQQSTLLLGNGALREFTPGFRWHFTPREGNAAGVGPRPTPPNEYNAASDHPVGSRERIRALRQKRREFWAENRAWRSGVKKAMSGSLGAEALAVFSDPEHYRLETLADSLLSAALNAMRDVERWFQQRVRAEGPYEIEGELFETVFLPSLPGIFTARLERHLTDTRRTLLQPSNSANPAALAAQQRLLDIEPLDGSLLESPQRLVADSRRGLICPLETPESESVGLTLFLARSASVVRTSVCDPQDGEGGSASVRKAVAEGQPLFHLVVGESESAGSGATQSVEQDAFLSTSASLIPFVDYDDPNRAMLGAKNLKQSMPLIHAQDPLIRTCFEEAQAAVMLGPEARSLQLGVNLTVAYMPWYGYNFEDAIVVSETAAKLLTARYRSGSDTETGETYSDYPLNVGDKLTGRHGNKGVVSLILPDDQMPCTESGEPIQMLLNPHGVLSRMNTGVLYETHWGAVAAKEGISITVRPFSDEHREKYGWSVLEQRLNQRGLPQGKARIHWQRQGEERREAEVVVGVQYILRLHHLSEEKAKVCGASPPPSAITRQPARPGQGGGQKLGEMEFWALLSHGAENNVRAMLGSNAEVDTGRVEGALPESTRVFLHHVRAAGINPQLTDSKGGEIAWEDPACVLPEEVRLLFKAAADEDVRRWTARQEEACVKGQAVHFPVSYCDSCGSRWPAGQHTVPYFLPEDINADPKTIARALRHASAREKDRKDRTYHDLLHVVMKPEGWDAGTPSSSRRALAAALNGVMRRPKNVTDSEALRRELGIEVSSGATDAAGTSNSTPSELNTTKSLALRRHVRLLLERLICQAKPGALRPCPPVLSHGRHGLCGGTPRTGYEYAEDGLFGSASFGNPRRVSQPLERRQGGRVELCLAVPHPLFFKAETPEAWLQCLYVPPPGLRPLQRGRVEGLNHHYQRVLAANERAEKAGATVGSPEWRALVHRVAALFGRRPIFAVDGSQKEEPVKSGGIERFTSLTASQAEDNLADRLSGKGGLIRGYILNKRQRNSGRAVIVPDPTLEFGTCRLPEVARQLLFEGVANPVALLNRNPTLHRYGMVALKVDPELTGDGEGRHVIGLHPLLCGGLGADFDGDTMAYYRLPDPEEATARMQPQAHLFSVANGDLTLHFTQDIVSGAWLASRDGEGALPTAFLQAEGMTPVGRPLDEKSLRASVTAFLRSEGAEERETRVKEIDLLMRHCLEAATCDGLSFSVGDLIALRDALKANSSEKALVETLQSKPFRRGAVATMVLSGARGKPEQVRRMCVSAATGANGAAAPYISGLPFSDFYAAAQVARREFLPKKRGTPHGGQLMRTLAYGLYPVQIVGEDCVKESGEDRTENAGVDLVSALQDSWPDAVPGETDAPGRDRARAAAFLVGRVLARPAGTLKAGTQLNAGDAALLLEGSREKIYVRSPLTCRYADEAFEGIRGVCAACYGTDLATNSPPVMGMRIGLIAAQSIGERATQDFMKSFHGTQTQAQAHLHSALRIFLYWTFPSGLASLKNDLSRLLGWLVHDVYEAKVDPRHFEVALRWADTSDPKTSGLEMAAKRHSALSRVAYVAHFGSLGWLAEQAKTIAPEDFATEPAALFLGRTAHG